VRNTVIDAPTVEQARLDDVMSDNQCERCKGHLTEIDHCGERLIGCINRWGRPGDKRLVLELLEEDIEALSNLSDKRHKDEDTSP
jgi:hypothetical protein